MDYLDCPWPADIWTMTDKEYKRAVPDERLRTAISGFLMRKGWEICIGQMKDLLNEVEKSADGRSAQSPHR